MPRFMDNDLFIKKAKEIHGDRYSYSLTKYVRSIEKVVIVCIVHGGFLQKPNGHLGGHGCPECGKITSREKQRLGRHGFIDRARKIHGYKYHYDYVDCKRNTDKVPIVCPIHGLFYQDVANHLSGKGCAKCGVESSKISGTYTTEDFISRSTKRHNGKYDYSKSIYIHSENKIEIICKDHGSFWQTPKMHMSGAGCMKCCIDGRTGKNSATYKHGKSKKHRAERYNKENYHWTKEIKKSSNCDCCGVAFDDNFTKHAHHLDGWVNFPNKRYDVNNGVCLCHNCHYDFHSKYGSGYNTREQYLQFKETAEWVK